MIKKFILSAAVIVSIYGITSCVSNDYEEDLIEAKVKKNDNNLITDTINVTAPNSAGLTDAVEDDGDREKWGNTKRQ